MYLRSGIVVHAPTDALRVFFVGSERLASVEIGAKALSWRKITWLGTSFFRVTKGDTAALPKNGPVGPTVGSHINGVNGRAVAIDANSHTGAREIGANLTNVGGRKLSDGFAKEEPIIFVAEARGAIRASVAHGAHVQNWVAWISRLKVAIAIAGFGFGVTIAVPISVPISRDASLIGR